MGEPVRSPAAHPHDMARRFTGAWPFRLWLRLSRDRLHQKCGVEDMADWQQRRRSARGRDLPNSAL